MAADGSGVRRRARGVARIDQLLAAAAVVIARDGYARATTNAIAAQAGVSPGTLYQFFRDRAAMAAALSQRYAALLDEVHEEAFRSLPSDLPLTDVLDRIIDPLVAFKGEHAAFSALFALPVLPPALAEPVERSEAAFRARVADLLRARNDGVEPALAATVAETVIALVRGVLVQVEPASPLLGEVKTAIAGYLHERGLR